jgi:hypothetical protein
MMFALGDLFFLQYQHAASLIYRLGRQLRAAPLIAIKHLQIKMPPLTEGCDLSFYGENFQHS